MCVLVVARVVVPVSCGCACVRGMVFLGDFPGAMSDRAAFPSGPAPPLGSIALPSDPVWSDGIVPSAPHSIGHSHRAAGHKGSTGQCDLAPYMLRGIVRCPRNITWVSDGIVTSLTQTIVDLTQRPSRFSRLRRTLLCVDRFTFACLVLVAR